MLFCFFLLMNGEHLPFEPLFTFYTNYCQCVIPNMHVKVPTYVKQCHSFRDPITVKMNLNHLTEERRFIAIFYWAHVLGTTAEVIGVPMRTHTIVSVFTLQLLMIATRRHRTYTKRELEVICHDNSFLHSKRSQNMPTKRTVWRQIGEGPITPVHYPSREWEGGCTFYTLDTHIKCFEIWMRTTFSFPNPVFNKIVYVTIHIYSFKNMFT